MPGGHERALSIAVVPVITAPKYEMIVTGQQKSGSISEYKTGSYAGKGTLGGAFAGLRVAVICGPFAAYCAPFFTVVGGVVGGVGGLVVGAVSDFKAAYGSNTNASSLDKDSSEDPGDRGQTLMELVAGQVVERGSGMTGYSLRSYPATTSRDREPAYSSADTADPKTRPPHAELNGVVDSVLEIRVVKSGLIYDQEISEYTTFFDVQARLIRPGNWSAFHEVEHRYLAPGHAFRSWSPDQWSQELARASGILGASISESIFLESWQFPVDRTWDKHHCVLRPLSPASLEAPKAVRGGRPDATSNSLSPTLAWEAFPRQREGVTEKEGLSGEISEVTYDLRVWKQAANGSPGELVYERVGITAEAGSGSVVLMENITDEGGQSQVRTWTVSGIRSAEHATEGQLEPDTDYLWSIRARYQIRKQQGITTWSRYRMTEYPGDSCEPGILSPYAYYRFKTPGFSMEAQK